MNELSKIIFVDVDDKEYMFSGSSGDGARPGPNSVGSAEIKDESVEKQDLNKDIQDKLDLLNDSNIVTEEELDDEWQQAMNNAMNGGGTQEAGADEGDDTGDGPGLDEI